MSTQMAARNQHWLSRYLFVLLAAVLLAGAALYWYAPQAGRQAELAAAEARVVELQAEISSLETEIVTQHNDALKVVTGRDLSRQLEDDVKAEAMLQVATTWSGVNQYINARDELMRVWNLDERSAFMTIFMPGEEQGAYRVDGEGKMHFAFPGANSRLSGFESTLTSIVEDEWSYFALVTTTTASAEGGRQSSWTAVTYTIDGEGEITDVMAWPSKQPPQRSGD